MWEMQQQGRRAGALDADLISNRLGEMTVFVVCPGLRAVGLDERVWTVFEGLQTKRLEVDLISVLSTGKARGTNSSLGVCGIRAAHLRCSKWMCSCFELCCLVVGEKKFQPTQLSGLCYMGRRRCC